MAGNAASLSPWRLPIDDSACPVNWTRETLHTFDQVNCRILGIYVSHRGGRKINGESSEEKKKKGKKTKYHRDNKARGPRRLQ